MQNIAALELRAESGETGRRSAGETQRVAGISHRDEIDGLRSIAVTSVILYHAGLAAFPGGYLGVDVFFVISGFLITSILLRDLENDNFSIVRFYERRCRRILPALFLVTTLSAIPAVFLLLPSQLTEYGRSLVATALFVSNFLFANEVDYFTNAADLKPLIHTWSLSVEEQFYIFFPPLLFLLFGRGFRAVFWVLLSAAVLSLAVAQYGSINSPEQNFFLTHVRVWELAVGALAAVIYTYRPQSGGNVASLAGLAMVVLPMFFFGKPIVSPSLYTAVPVLGTALIILFGQGSTHVGRLLSLRPFVFIGLVSYSAYLWHQPLFAYARIYFNGEAPWGVMAALIGLTFVLSYYSWRYIENPVRAIRTGLLTRNWIFVWAALSIAVTAGMGLLFASGAIKSRVQVDELVIDPVTEWNKSKNLHAANPDYDTETSMSGERINVLILGDSHSHGTINMLRSLQNSELSSYEFARRTMPLGCLLSHGEGGTLREVVDYCMGTWGGDAVAKLFNDSDALLLSMRWAERDYLIQYIPHLIAWARDRSLKTIILSNMPEWTTGSPMVIRSFVDGLKRDEIKAEDINSAFQPHLNPKIDKLNVLLEDLTVRNGGLFLYKQDYSCDDRRFCYGVTPDLKAMHTDYGHETVNGALFYAQRIADRKWFDPVGPFVTDAFSEVTTSDARNAESVDRIMGVLGVTRGKVITGTNGDDKLVGTEGNDTIKGGKGDDEIDGLDGNDLLIGGPGNDVLRSGKGKNRMNGGAGDDVFYPGPGNNIVRSGKGADRVVVTESIGYLTLHDLVSGTDIVDVSAIATAAELDQALAAMTRDRKGYLVMQLGRLTVVVKSLTMEEAKSGLFIAGKP